ncbi:GIY-YIG domain-containing protein [Fusarium sp. LHS14.1]|nr:GIY-YIG domain-containing protein [Fusarium sp. LHS14.1]
MVDKEVHDALAAFVAERDWAQFHTPENLAKSISIEAAELLECYQWNAEADPKRIREELADVLTYCLLLADRIGVDPAQIVLDKLEVTKKKYPVDKAKGSSKKLDFSKDAVTAWRAHDESHRNWPVVYVLDDGHNTTRAGSNQLRDIYVGESLNAAGRLRQHLETPTKQHLKNIHVIFDKRFNKSVCLDLESYLIKMLAGDGANRVLNRNNGITDSRYFQRELYREGFRNIFERLRADGVFTRGLDEIENSDLFKLSPFKALTSDQAASVEEIVKGLLADLENGTNSMIVIQGDPGTGKTVAAIYLIKLLVDIQTFTTLEDLDSDARFATFFTDTNKGLLQDLRVGLVVPQQSLRSSIKAVFKKTPGLHPSMVMSPFDVGEADGTFSLLLVDETHRLNQRANQASGVLNAKFATITKELFGGEDFSKTQLHWIRAKSRHQIFLLDAAQSVRPADLPSELLSDLVADARATRRHFQLRTQMRVRAGSDFVSYVRWILDPHPLELPRMRRDFGDYDFRTFDCVARMRDEIFQRDAEVGLSRMVAGFAWEWRTKKDKTAFDIVIGDTQLRWNGTPTDWISSRNALEEVGSIHTVQGYDLNYVGVIIGRDLRFDPARRRLFIDRDSYFDKKGKENNPALGKKYSDDDLMRFITQIYAVLMTRGIRGTYVYACDPGLREYLKGLIPFHS